MSITLNFWLTLVEVNWWQGEECKIVSFVSRGGGSCCCCYESYFIIILFLIFLYKNNTFLSYNNLKCHSAISFVQSVQTNETSAKRAQWVTQAQVEKTGNKYFHRETRLFLSRFSPSAFSPPCLSGTYCRLSEKRN